VCLRAGVGGDRDRATARRVGLDQKIINFGAIQKLDSILRNDEEWDGISKIYSVMLYSSSRPERAKRDFDARRIDAYGTPTNRFIESIKIRRHERRLLFLRYVTNM